MPWGIIVFGSLLVLLSLVLLAVHYNTWRKADHGGLSERDRDFARRQFRRRTQASGMLGAIGLVMLSMLWVDDTVMQALLWLAMLFALLWVMLIALSDWWSTRTFYGRDQVVNAVEIELLKKEIRKYQAEQEPKERGGS